MDDSTNVILGNNYPSPELVNLSWYLQGDAGGDAADQAMQSEVGEEEEIKEDSPQNDNDDTNDSDQG